MTPQEWAHKLRWEAGRRSLMLLHPHFGLQRAGLFLGTWQSGMTLGWNRIRRDAMAMDQQVYIRIEENAGETTVVPPAEASGPIHDVQSSAPPLHDSPLWTAFSTAAEACVRDGTLTEAMRQSVTAAVEDAAGDLRQLPLMEARWREAMQEMRTALRTGDGMIRAGDFFAPMFRLLRDYDACLLTGTVALEVLGVVLSTQCTAPYLGPPETMPRQMRVAAIDHLANVAYRLIAQRDALDLISSLQASFLASLYLGAATRICTWAEPSGQHNSQDLQRLKKLNLNLDELFAHRIAPVFMLPALFTPREMCAVVSATARQAQKTRIEIAEFFQLHPTLRALLDNWEDKAEDDIITMLDEGSRTRGEFDFATATREWASPVAEQNLVEITLVLAAASGPRRS